MPASLNDKFTNASSGTRPAPAKLTAVKAIGAASISCDALTGWPTGTAVHFVIYNTATSGTSVVKVAGSQTDWKGIVSGTTITNLTLRAGSDTSYNIGAVVEAGPTAAWADDMVAGATLEHTTTGTHTSTAATTIAALLPSGSVSATALSPGIPSNKFLNPYKFSVYRNAAATLSGNTKIAFDTKLFDTGSNYDSATNFRFTAPIAGFYQFDACVGWSLSNRSNTAYGVYLYKNGSVFKNGSQDVNMFSGSVAIYKPGSWLVQAVANDYFEIYAVGNSSGDPVITGPNGTYFEGYLVSAT